MADNETPADDLRTLLSQSFDQAAAPEVEPIVAEPAAKVEPAEPEPQADAGDDRPRGPDGKFLKKDEADAKADVATAKDGGKQQKDEASAKTPDAEDPAKVGKEADKAEAKADATEAPANWSASDKAMFKLQSPDAQAFLLRRHSAMEADYTKKTAAIADLKKEYEPIQQLFSPYVDVLKQKGLTPQTVIRRWADVETALANGRGVDIIDGIVKSYGIDKAVLAQRLGFTSTGSATPSTETGAAAPAGTASPAPIELPPAVAEEIRQVDEEIRQLRARLDAREQLENQAKISAAKAAEDKVEADITNFKSAKGADGELQHPYFDEVEPAMIALAQSYVASGQQPPKLDELYERAVWANPSTRAAILAAQKAAEQAKATEEARAKSRQAQRAASSVTGAPGSGQASKPIRGELSLREQLMEAADGL